MEFSHLHNNSLLLVIYLNIISQAKHTKHTFYWELIAPPAGIETQVFINNMFRHPVIGSAVFMMYAL